MIQYQTMIYCISWIYLTLQSKGKSWGKETNKNNETSVWKPCTDIKAVKFPQKENLWTQRATPIVSSSLLEAAQVSTGKVKYVNWEKNCFQKLQWTKGSPQTKEEGPEKLTGSMCNINSVSLKITTGTKHLQGLT